MVPSPTDAARAVARVVNGNISVRNISMGMEILEISERVSEILEIFKKYI